MNMGEVSPLKIGVPRPRPLGLVKRESIHFEDVESTTNNSYGKPLSTAGGSGSHNNNNHKNLNWTPGTLVELGRSKTEGDIKRDLKSMRDLQETLRQAALLNIVAAVNHDDRLMDSLPPTRAGGGGGGGGGSQSVGIKGASILGHNIPTPSNKLLVASSSNGEGIINIGHFSHNLQSASNGLHTMTPAATSQSQNSSAINQILTNRTRTISIPRPRTQNDQGSFMHKSLLDAKENLSSMTTFRAGIKKELDGSNNQAPTNSSSQKNHTSEELCDTPKQNVTTETKKELVREVSCIRGTGMESSNENNNNSHHDKSTKESGPNHNHSGDTSGPQNPMTKDEQRAHNVHQMQVVKRHIPTSKKKEIMKKLTDIAKCDAMDMAVPITSTDVNSAPPIIIMSQQKGPLVVDTTDFKETASTRTKSMTSLNSRSEDHKVPSNTRVQSETIDSLLHHREAKKKASLKVEEDLIIGNFNGNANNEKKSNGVDGFYRIQRDQRMPNIEAFSPSNPLSQEPFFVEHNLSKSLQYSDSPDFLELRPVEGSTLTRNRRRQLAPRRTLAVHSRDKLISPSPVVYEASFHRPKASMGHIALVGQSVQAQGDRDHKVDQPSNKTQQQTKLGNGFSQPAPGVSRSEESTKKLWSDPKAMSLKHWGSPSKPATNSPILRTEILDHLQCVGLINQRPTNNYHKKYNFKASGALAISNFELNRCDQDEYCDYIEDDEEDDSSDTPRAVKNNAVYRKSKLYNAFRASEENLSNLVDPSGGMETETMTGKSLLNQPIAPAVQPKETAPPSSQDPTNAAGKEPLYMGCSSRVSENDFRSQFHYASEADEMEAHKGANFKVMKAIDQDVYFDFQHKKYRKTNDSPLNTAADKPRMHFLKIKFNGEAKT